MQVRFLASPLERDAQLRAWGLAAEPLTQAVLWARTFYNDCTRFDPGGFNLISSYAKAGRRLRELFIPRGWAVCDLNNQTAIRHDTLRLRLYPCNFCSATANEARTPKNLSDKGSAAQDDTEANAPNLFTYGLPHVVPEPVVESFRGYTTLVLGMNFESEHAKAEVSLPVKFMDGKFKAFLVRVPLLDGQAASIAVAPKVDDDSAFGEVDIPIKVVS